MRETESGNARSAVAGPLVGRETQFSFLPFSCYLFRRRTLTVIARYAIAALLVAIASAAPAVLHSAQSTTQPRKVFRSGLNLVSVDVIVRDRSGAVVRGLTAADFEVREDGKAQGISSFSFEEITNKTIATVESAGLL